MNRNIILFILVFIAIALLMIPCDSNESTTENEVAANPSGKNTTFRDSIDFPSLSDSTSLLEKTQEDS